MSIVELVLNSTYTICASMNDAAIPFAACTIVYTVLRVERVTYLVTGKNRARI